MLPATEFTLDPSLFNVDLWTSVLHFWLPTYPNPSSDFNREDVLRWFAGSASTDEKVHAIAGRAISSIGPDALQLPPFTTLEADRMLYDVIATPFVHLLDEWSDVSTTSADSSTLAHPRAALALAILLDQFPRNLFRGATQAVVYRHYDRIARAVAAQVDKRQLNCGTELVNAPVWRIWFYMPLQHTESISDHEYFRSVLDEAVEKAKEAGDEMGAKFLEHESGFEEKHYGPLRQFGRFPWRNVWLGRESTEAEKAWLQERGDQFGTG